MLQTGVGDVAVRIADSCRVGPLTASASNDNGLQTAGLPIGGLAFVIGEVVGAILGLVGLTVIVTNASEPTEDLILRLVEELQQDPDTGRDIQTRTREKEESCQLDFERFGTGSFALPEFCLLYTSPSPRDKRQSRMPSSA